MKANRLPPHVAQQLDEDLAHVRRSVLAMGGQAGDREAAKP